MEAAPPSRRRVLAVVAAAVLACLGLYGALVVLRDDDSPARSATSTSVPGGPAGSSPIGTPQAGGAPDGPSTPSTTTITPDGAPEPAPDTGTDGATATDAPTPEACAMLRQLLEIIDDAELRAAAETVGCI